MAQITNVVNSHLPTCPHSPPLFLQKYSPLRFTISILPTMHIYIGNYATPCNVLFNYGGKWRKGRAAKIKLDRNATNLETDARHELTNETQRLPPRSMNYALSKSPPNEAYERSHDNRVSLDTTKIENCQVHQAQITTNTVKYSRSEASAFLLPGLQILSFYIYKQSVLSGEHQPATNPKKKLTPRTLGCVGGSFILRSCFG